MQRTKLIYGDIKPAKYDLNDFDKDLDKLMNRKYKEVTSYIASQLSEGPQGRAMAWSSGSTQL